MDIAIDKLKCSGQGKNGRMTKEQNKAADAPVLVCY